MSKEAKENSSEQSQKELFKSGRDVIFAWLAAVNSGNVENILRLYEHDALLLPTFSPDFLSDHDSLRPYFTQLAARPNIKVELEPESLQEQLAGADVCVVTGLYAFSFDLDGRPRSFPSRFTFVLDMASSSPIRHHHSTLLPDPLS